MRRVSSIVATSAVILIATASSAAASTGNAGSLGKPLASAATVVTPPNPAPGVHFSTGFPCGVYLGFNYPAGKKAVFSAPNTFDVTTKFANVFELTECSAPAGTLTPAELTAGAAGVNKVRTTVCGTETGYTAGYAQFEFKSDGSYQLDCAYSSGALGSTVLSFLEGLASAFTGGPVSFV